MRRANLGVAVIAGLCGIGFAVAGEPADMNGAKTPNGKLVLDFMHLEFEEGNPKGALEKYTAPGFVGHAYLKVAYDKALREAEGSPAPPPTTRPKMWTDIKKVVVDGELVFVNSILYKDPPVKLANGEMLWCLFRVKNGKIVEYWHTHDPIPDSEVGKQF